VRRGNSIEGRESEKREYTMNSKEEKLVRLNTYLYVGKSGYYGLKTFVARGVF